jgi:hypothetical protein
LTSQLIEKSAIRSNFNAQIILRKSNIEEYLPNIIGNLQYIEIIQPPTPPPTPLPTPLPLPVVVFDEEHTRDCPICLENKSRFNQTNCNHLFCTDCFIGIRSNRCPLCRANI